MNAPQTMTPMEKPSEPGYYFATDKCTGERMLVDVDYATIRQDRLKVCAIGRKSSGPLTRFDRYAKPIDPLARAEVQG